MDIKEFLEDSNNKILAIAIAVVVVIGIAFFVIYMVMNGNKSDSSGSGTAPVGIGGPATTGMPSGSGMPSGPGMPNSPGMPSGPGMPSAPSMPGDPMAGTPGAPDAMAPTDMASADNPQPADDLKGKPMEPGRIDPFAPIGVARASKTKTFGDTIKNRMLSEGIDFTIPSQISAVSFTDYTPQTKIGYVKTAAEIKAEKDKKEAKKLAEEKKQADLIKAIIYKKPDNVRLSSVMSGKNIVASFEVVYGNYSDFQSLKVGEKLTYGYNQNGEKLQAKVKSIGANSAVLQVVGNEDIEWNFNVSDGSSRNNGAMNGMGGNRMPGAMGPMGGGMSPMGRGPAGINPMGNPMGGNTIGGANPMMGGGNMFGM